MKRIIIMYLLAGVITGCSSPRLLAPNEMQALLLNNDIDSFAYSIDKEGSVHLVLDSGTVTNIHYLSGVKIDHLTLWNTLIEDLHPLGTMELKSLHITSHLQTNGISVLRGASSLTNINDRPPEQFWSMYDAGHWVDRPDADPLKGLWEALYPDPVVDQQKKIRDTIVFGTMRLLLDQRAEESNKRLHGTGEELAVP